MTCKIWVLDKITADKIAAGEVVENPSSVVKELIENSIDAGADFIVVEIENGGRSLIRVTDNGEGIDGSEVPRAFMRHATSKIKGAEDLDRILSLGFRGEALASIAAVSRVILTTRLKNKLAGTYYHIEGGKEVEYCETGCPQGTSVEVRDLFYNTPARREYLKSDSREASYVSDIVSRLALSRTDISFRYIMNGKTLISTPGNKNTADTIVSIYGTEIGSNLIHIGCNSSGIKIEGFISKPHITRATRRHQTFFVNGRYVRSKIISQAIQDAYRTLVMVNRHPVAVLFITVDPSYIDVNVHPTKLQVRFKDESSIMKSVTDCIRLRLHEGRWIARPAQSGFSSKQIDSRAKQKINTSWVQIRASLSDDSVCSKDVLEQKSLINEQRLEYNREEVDNNIKDYKNKIPEMKVIGQFLSTFVIAEGKDCIYIIDQHAAHERIIFEQLCESMQKNVPRSQRLLEPLVIQLTPDEIQIIHHYSEILTKIGFEMDDFGQNTVAVRAVPVFFGIPQTKEFLKDLVDTFSKTGSKNDYRFNEEKIIKMSCRKAVKANNRLSMEEMEALVKQLKKADMPFTCPHGRPVITSLTRYELERMFKRVL